jgi:cell division protein ZipA
MELSVREWTIIVGVLLILAVFLDGYRRVRNERSNRIRVTLSKQVFNHHVETVVADAPTAANPELPNGGARVIAKQRNQDLHLREAVPVLIEPVQMAAAQEQAATDSDAEDGFPLEAMTAADTDAIPADDRSIHQASEQLSTASQPAAQPNPAARQRAAAAEPAVAEAPASKRLWGKKSKHHEVEQSYLDEMVDDMVEEQRKPVEPQEVLVVNVLSKDKGGFNGPDLLQILLACDLRFGKMQIFHRFENANGRGPIQFSLANLLEPGTFDLDAIDSFCTPGVSFFLTLPGPQQSLTAFNYMIETAQVLVRNLNAELRDDAHSVMTAQTIEHCRQRIRDFERKQLTLQL